MTPIDIDSRVTFRQAVPAALEAAIGRGARRIVCVDRDFADWPLDTPALHAELADWLRRPQRQLVLLAAGYDAVVRTHPRFCEWRADWMHAIDARVPADRPPREWPTLLVDDGPVCLSLWQREPWRGRAALDPLAARAARDAIDADLQHSVPGWPTRPLGL
jgi:hypothetical protein